MKKTIVFLTQMVFVISLIACSESQKQNSTQDNIVLDERLEEVMEVDPEQAFIATLKPSAYKDGK